MFDSIQIGMSGLKAFSDGLQVISNNIANLNTVGFKGALLNFTDMMPQQQGAHGNPTSGNGVAMKPPVMNFGPGQAQSTGNPLNAMITGEGLFVMRNGSNTHYTRNGQFQFDPDGFLTSVTTGYRVAGVASGGALADISLSGLEFYPATPTSKILLKGNLAPGATTDVVDKIGIIDSTGTSQVISLNFSRNTNAGTGQSITWTCNAKLGTSPIGTAMTVGFTANGVAPGSETQVLIFTPPGGQQIRVTLDFNGATSTSPTTTTPTTTSTLAVSTNDGVAAGSITGESFDSTGTLIVSYSNGKNKNGPQLALAQFQSPADLSQIGNSDFVSLDAKAAQIVKPGIGSATSITAGQIEGSNVDISDAFGQLIIAQRAYQSSSRVITTADQMLQELLQLEGNH